MYSCYLSRSPAVRELLTELFLLIVRPRFRLGEHFFQDCPLAKISKMPFEIASAAWVCMSRIGIIPDILSDDLAESLAVLVRLSPADTRNIEKFSVLCRQLDAHIAQSRVRKDYVRRNIFLRREFVAQLSQFRKKCSIRIENVLGRFL